MGVSGQRHYPDRALPPGKRPTVAIGQKAGWASEPSLDTEAREKNSLPLAGIEPRPPGCPVRSQTLY
jgi:hypothetical protein